MARIIEQAVQPQRTPRELQKIIREDTGTRLYITNVRNGRMKKASNRRVNWIMIQAANVAVRHDDRLTLVGYLKEMQRHFGKVAVVTDRASPHRAKLVKKLLRENKNIRIIYLQKGSPYLNAVRNAGGNHPIAITHVANKMVRIIWKMLTAKERDAPRPNEEGIQSEGKLDNDPGRKRGSAS